MRIEFDRPGLIPAYAFANAPKIVGQVGTAAKGYRERQSLLNHAQLPCTSIRAAVENRGATVDPVDRHILVSAEPRRANYILPYGPGGPPISLNGHETV